MLAGCTQAVVNGQLEGAADTSVVVSRLNINQIVPVDTVKTDAQGRFTCKEKIEAGHPQFYYLSYGGRQFASLVLLPKDRINVKADLNGNCQITGSKETELLNQSQKQFEASLKSFDSLSTLLSQAVADTEIHALRNEMAKVYIAQKRSALRHAMGNPYSITAIPVLYQRFGDLPIFGDYRDAITFKMIRDSVATVYPKSEYVSALSSEIDSRMKEFDLQNKLDNAVQVNFPEIILPDINAKEQKLSDLDGKVIVLFFWSYSQNAHKFFNNDLKDIYKKYHDRGLEIYQVSLDIDKSQWATVVRAQELPWISVCDGLGTDSPAVTAYNITQIPSLFIIGKDGNIKGRDVYDIAKLDSTIGSLL